jgi:dephospho-CoA kinase
LILVVAGLSGTGKSAVREQLSLELGYASLGPDDYEGAWGLLYPDLDAAHDAVVECVKLPFGLRKRIKARPSYIVELTCDSVTRRKRLERITHPAIARSRAMQRDKYPGLGYEEHVEPDLRLDTRDRTAPAVAKLIVTALGTAIAQEHAQSL